MRKDFIEQQIEIFSEHLESKGFSSFNSMDHQFFIDREDYKEIVHKEARKILKIEEWQSEDIGTGKILNAIIAAIELDISNLVQWDSKRRGEKSTSHYKLLIASREKNYTEIETAIFNLYKKSNDEAAFNQIVNVTGRRFDLLAYLLFLKNKFKYLPIAPKIFEKAFLLVGVNQKLNQKCSWENYLEYLSKIRNVKIYLETKFNENLDLLKAHSFLFTLAYESYDKLEPEKRKFDNFHVETIKPIPRETKAGGQVNHLGQKASSLLDVQKRKIEIGNEAEEAVLEYEKLKLLDSNKSNLAKRVSLDPSKDPMSGYDIDSFDIKGRKIKIEVKAVSGNKFIITRQEIKKANELEDYYLYLVNLSNFLAPKIKVIESPIFEQNVMFNLIPLNFEAKFK